MDGSERRVRVAVVQAAAVLFDREASVAKACRLAAEAAGQGARVILFPEAFVPAYPRSLTFGTVVGGRTAEGRRVWQRYWDQSVEVPGPATEALGAAARQAGAYLAVGVVERGGVEGRSAERTFAERGFGFSGGTLYCTLLYFGPDGRLLGKHRKIKPTAGERIIWGEGDGSTLTVIDSPYGRIGGLICWENYMPLARMAIYGKGVDFYLAPTADARDSWHATLRHIACEGRCFVLGCNQFVTRAMLPADLVSDQGAGEAGGGAEILCRGGSAIVSPLGEVLAGPLYDREGMLTADLDLGEIARGRFDLDVTGHYARSDIFQLIVDERPRPAVVYRGGEVL